MSVRLSRLESITLPAFLSSKDAKRVGIKVSVSCPLAWPAEKKAAVQMLRDLRVAGIASAIIFTRGSWEAGRGFVEVWREPPPLLDNSCHNHAKPGKTTKDQRMVRFRSNGEVPGVFGNRGKTTTA